MRKAIVLLTAIMLLLSACSSASLEGAGKELQDTVANITDTDNKYVQMVKSGYRTDNPDLSYDGAFSAFFGTPRWKYFKGEDGQDVVEFTGDCVYRDVSVKARIQFVVDEENGTFEATYLAFNEVPQDALTLMAVIEKAFESSESTSSPNRINNSAINQISHKKVKISSLLGESIEKVIDAWGTPEYTDYSLEYKEISVSLSDNKVSGVSGLAEHFSVNNQSLCMTKDEIIQMFGEPDLESAYSYGIDLIYDVPDYELIITVVAESGYAEYISIAVPSEAGGNFQNGDDDYSGGNENYGNYASLDYSLCGRWRSYNGLSLTLDEYGYASVNWKIWDFLTSTPASITWSASNGRLNFISHFQFEYRYRYGIDNRLNEPYERLTLDDGYYSRKDTGTNSIVGKWDYSQFIIGGPIQINADGTGEYTITGIPFTWYTIDDTFVMGRDQGRSYDYTVSGDTLTMFFDDGVEIFTRVGS